MNVDGLKRSVTAASHAPDVSVFGAFVVMKTTLGNGEPRVAGRKTAGKSLYSDIMTVWLLTPVGSDKDLFFDADRIHMLEELVRIYSGVQDLRKDSLTNLLTSLETSIARPSDGVAPPESSDQAAMMDSDSEDIVNVEAVQPCRELNFRLLLPYTVLNADLSALWNILSFQFLSTSSEDGDVETRFECTRR